MKTLSNNAQKAVLKNLYSQLKLPYHYLLAFLGALLYRFPSRQLKVVAITGTKGKSSVAELTNAILEEASFKTALLSTIRFKVDKENKPNVLKMTTPGRFFVQKFLRRAMDAKCDYAIIEMTSEAARQFRHKFIAFDALIFTNLSPEHIESHGSYEKYVAAKLSIGQALENSAKKNRVLVANADEKEAEKFLALNIPNKLPYSLKNSEPYEAKTGGISFTFAGEKINPKLEGIFNIYNCLAAATFAKSQGVGTEIIKRGLEKVSVIKGRVEHIDCGQNFTVIVDYAHTPDSLEKLYQTFPNHRKIALLGNTGGGRDTWKRPVMAGIAEKYCDEVILTNEDPYDENPQKILNEMAAGMKNKKPKIILDRREAIATALRSASAGDVVLITGKGTDPCICGPNGTKLPWGDASVVQEELKKI
ncbi:MAG: UDP-N-acetylmuramoyl-L-alanyl-D-glutamate--2,6-diaminopimelate ligase [bacterium]|nr:UDP-N-acetylmuramoyl-L-alanyl-D-glutamate--2,6-diaminopimelate ligase [bacterium]